MSKEKALSVDYMKLRYGVYELVDLAIDVANRVGMTPEETTMMLFMTSAYVSVCKDCKKGEYMNFCEEVFDYQLNQKFARDREYGE